MKFCLPATVKLNNPSVESASQVALFDLTGTSNESGSVNVAGRTSRCKALRRCGRAKQSVVASHRSDPESVGCTSCFIGSGSRDAAGKGKMQPCSKILQ